MLVQKIGTNIDIDDGEGDKDHQDESDEAEKSENKQNGFLNQNPNKSVSAGSISNISQYLKDCKMKILINP